MLGQHGLSFSWCRGEEKKTLLRFKASQFSVKAAEKVNVLKSKMVINTRPAIKLSDEEREKSGRERERSQSERQQSEEEREKSGKGE
mgnify:CR=1 FL=1